MKTPSPHPAPKTPGTFVEIEADDAKWRDMAVRCFEMINVYRERGDQKPFIQIVTPYPWKSPKGFPANTIDCVNSEGDAVRRVRADKLLEALAKAGLIKITTSKGNREDYAK